MPKFAAVLPAGGLGKRMGANLPKQLLPLGDKPVYRHSLETFLDMPQISEVVLAVPAEWKAHFESELKSPLQSGKLKIVIGGKDRWLSVRKGIEALSPQIDYALIHDVARPLLSRELILQVIETLVSKGACLVAKPSADTVKVVKQGEVQGTIPRDEIFLAQTPQAASVELFKKLYQRLDAEPLSFVPTDEASILEHFKIPVHIVPGNSLNDKLTTPPDLEMFRAILEKRLNAPTDPSR